MDDTIRDPSCREQGKRAFLRIKRQFPQRGKIELFVGNGACGLPEHFTYDANIVAATVRRLKDIARLPGQLHTGGRFLYLYGDRNVQTLYIQ